MIKTFKKDLILRDKDNKPLGRVILKDEYVEGEDLRITLLEVPLIYSKNVKTLDFFVDGLLYKIPEDISDIKVNKVGLKWLVNSFILKRLG